MKFLLYSLSLLVVLCPFASTRENPRELIPKWPDYPEDLKRNVVYQEDDEVPYQAAIYIDSKFACSGLIVKDDTIITAASCVSACKWSWFKYDKFPASIETLAIATRQTLMTPLITPTLGLEKATSLVIDPSFDPCSESPQGRNLAKITFKPRDGHPHPSINLTKIAKSVCLDHLDRVSVLGWTSTGKEMNQTLNRNLAMVVRLKHCPKREVIAHGEACLVYRGTAAFCSGDIGSPIYGTGADLELLGIISRIDNKGEYCVQEIWPDTMIVVTRATEIMKFLDE